MITESMVPRILKSPAVLRLLLVAFCLPLVMVIPLAAQAQQAAGQVPMAGESVEGSTDQAGQASLNEAIGQARQRIAADPSSAKAQVMLGDLLLTKGSLEEAEKAFDAALALNARDHDALTGKGIVLARMGKVQAAEEMLQKALILNPNPVRTYYELGLLYEKRGDYEKAIAEYKNGIEKYKQGRR